MELGDAAPGRRRRQTMTANGAHLPELRLGGDRRRPDRGAVRTQRRPERDRHRTRPSGRVRAPSGGAARRGARHDVVPGRPWSSDLGRHGPSGRSVRRHRARIVRAVTRSRAQLRESIALGAPDAYVGVGVHADARLVRRGAHPERGRGRGGARRVRASRRSWNDSSGAATSSALLRIHAARHGAIVVVAHRDGRITAA